MRLLPGDSFSRLGYLWLAYLAWPLYFGATSHDPVAFAFTLGSVALFLPIYFWGYWLNGPRAFVPIVLIVAVGVALSRVNSGAGVFFVYAGAFAFRARRVRAAVGTLAGIAAVVVAQGLLSRADLPDIAWPATFTVLVGSMMIYGGEAHRKTLEAQAESRRLAVVAERERIGRDLHDLLGHTLSVIALKSELATRLGQDEPARALREIHDVERISREALAEVRRAVTGYGEPAQLHDEIERAKGVLAAANVRLETDVRMPVAPAIEPTLAFVVREAVTNVIRHAGASQCSIALIGNGREIVLSISDDGRGGSDEEGAGLRGMRARVSSVGGRLRRDADNGTRLTITVPVSPARAGAA